MERTELAWAAGFWDGEGSAYLTGRADRATRQPQARLNQAGAAGVPEVLMRFVAVVGCGAVNGPQIKDGREPLYHWVASSRPDIERARLALWPWLGSVKKRQFSVVLGLDESIEGAELSGAEARAWAAGLFDGEGSVYLEKHRTHSGYFRLEAAITQVGPSGPPEVLTRFAAIAGIGTIYGPYPPYWGNDPVYRWKAHRAPQIIELIGALRPWIGAAKADQADRAIAIVSAQPPLARGDPRWGNRKTHCVNGHEYATARIRPYRARKEGGVQRRDSKQCLICVRELARRRRRERTMKEPRPRSRLR